jgi:hypothetical protein
MSPAAHPTKVLTLESDARALRTVHATGSTSALSSLQMGQFVATGLIEQDEQSARSLWNL